MLYDILSVLAALIGVAALGFAWTLGARAADLLLWHNAAAIKRRVWGK